MVGPIHLTSNDTVRQLAGETRGDKEVVQPPASVLGTGIHHVCPKGVCTLLLRIEVPVQVYCADQEQVLGMCHLYESTKPAFSNSVKPSLSSWVKPAFFLLVLGFLRSTSWCATFMSPQMMTGFSLSRVCTCSRNRGSHSSLLSSVTRPAQN